MENYASDREDANLIADFQARRESALATVYRLYWRILFTAARGILHEREDAEDCVHDTLVDVWAAKSSFRPERGSLRSFLVVCVRNAALTRKRSTTRHREIESAVYAARDNVEVVDFVTLSQLRSALLMLPPAQLQALKMAFFGQRTHVEIARELDLPLGTVKSRLALAIKKLGVHLR